MVLTDHGSRSILQEQKGLGRQSHQETQDQEKPFGEEEVPTLTRLQRVPPGYEVNHITPFYKGGADRVYNKRWHLADPPECEQLVDKRRLVPLLDTGKRVAYLSSMFFHKPEFLIKGDFGAIFPDHQISDRDQAPQLTGAWTIDSRPPFILS